MESPSSAVYLNVAHAAAYAAFGLLWLHAARLRRRSARALPAMLSDASRALGDSAPPLCVVLPVKGAHAQSAANWRAQCCSHGYAGPVSFLFVVQEEEDEAYSLVKQLQASGSLPTENVRVLVAGLAVGTSQKLHNLIHAVERIGEQSELVLMLDDDMLLAPGAVNLLAHKLLSDPNALAASGFSCDAPGRWTVLAHAACVYRLILEISVAGGEGSHAWGGCCLMRRADLLESVPGGVMAHWKNRGYSDDWIITAVARKQRRRIANPPLLFLNLVDFRSPSQLYNFFHRQFFVLDTYPQPSPDEPRIQAHRLRLESYALASLMGLGGAFSAAAAPSVAWQLFRLLSHGGASSAAAARGAPGGPCALLLARPDLASLSLLAAAALCCGAGAWAITRAQAAVIAATSSDAVERLRREGRGSLLLAPLGWLLYTTLCPVFAAHGVLGRSVVWSGARYTKRGGRVARVERLPKPPPPPPAAAQSPHATAAASCVAAARRLSLVLRSWLARFRTVALSRGAPAAALDSLLKPAKEGVESVLGGRSSPAP
uniref:ceramide glucosyltransferase n=1 Tax=Emiliania huxleyi TaxID=2903 RepID=A0A068EXV6_EMIHU|nr:ceramide glucosyltransferase 1 [Emiliania huxleyi]